MEVPLDYKLYSRDGRTHIGVVLLSTDHSLEMEWQKLLGDKALLFASRLAFSGDLTSASLGSIKEYIKNTSEYIATGLAF